MTNMRRVDDNNNKIKSRLKNDIANINTHVIAPVRSAVCLQDIVIIRHNTR